MLGEMCLEPRDRLPMCACYSANVVAGESLPSTGHRPRQNSGSKSLVFGQRLQMNQSLTLPQSGGLRSVPFCKLLDSTHGTSLFNLFFSLPKSNI